MIDRNRVRLRFDTELHLTETPRRRRWSDADKAAIVTEGLALGDEDDRDRAALQALSQPAILLALVVERRLADPRFAAYLRNPRRPSFLSLSQHKRDLLPAASALLDQTFFSGQ